MALHGSTRPHPRRWLWALVVVAGGVAAFGAWDLARALRLSPAPEPGVSLQLAQDASPPVGRPAPDFTLPLFSGGTLRLHSLRGKPVVLNFWASWCVPCREETPLLVRLHKTYKPRGVAFVGVDVQDEERDARAFLKEFHVNYAVVRAADTRVMATYSVAGIPTTIFIGEDGVVADKVTGAFIGPKGARALVTRLDRLLGTDKP